MQEGLKRQGLSEKIRDAKRARSYDGCSSKNKLEIQDKPRFKKRVSNHVPSMFLSLGMKGV